MPILEWLQSPQGSRLAASLLLVAPITLLLLLGLGEIAEGEENGAQHLVEVIPLVLLLIAGWRWPRVTGIALLGIGTLLFLLWVAFVLTVSERASPAVWAVVGLALFLPPLTAGWLLLKGSRRGT